MTHVIYCADGNKRYAETAIKYGLKYGAQMPRKVYFAPYFIDQNWKKPDREKYMEAMATHKPALATVLDLEHDEQFNEVMAWADEASQYVSEAVIIIPKVMGIVPRIPETVNGKQVRLGYSVPTSYGGTDLPLWEFGNRPVHLLGGSPHRQHELTAYLNVASADGNYITKIAHRHNKWLAAGEWIRLDEYYDDTKDKPYIAFELSVMNIKAMWSGGKTMIRWAVNDDLPQIKRIANQHKQGLGFVMLPSLRKAIEKRELYIACYGDYIVGFCNWHLRRDGIVTVYEIATEKTRQGEGIGRALLAALPDATIRLKCTQDNDANVFYERMGFVCIAVEEGRKRPLNVWQKAKAVN